MTKKDTYLLIAVSLILGIIITKQFFISQKIKAKVTPASNESLAYEVSELFKNCEKLTIEENRLKTEVEKLNKSSKDNKEIDDALSKKIHDYRIISGKVAVSGPGIKITFDKKIASTQVVDLLNALKNIGVDAVSVNGSRINMTSSIAEGTFYPPLVVEAIGDKELLYNSLERPGGIIDQIGYGYIEQIDQLKLPSL